MPEDFVADSEGAPLEGELTEPELMEAELTEAELTEAEEQERARGLPPLREVAEIRKPSTLGGVIYLCVLAAAMVGIAVAATGAWRTGVSWLALALIGAATARVVLPDDNAGMLRVRRKSLDAAILISAGVALLLLAASIPNQPG